MARACVCSTLFGLHAIDAFLCVCVPFLLDGVRLTRSTSRHRRDAQGRGTHTSG